MRTRPLGRRLAGERDSDGPMRVHQPVEFVPVEDVVLGACRIDELHRCLVIHGGVVAEHRHEGDHTGSNSHEEYGPSVGRLPDAVSADRSP